MTKTATDKQWEEWATKNPYYGVLGVESSAMDEANVERAFFESGEAHISRVLDVIDRNFGGFARRGSALDFGCGVGRLVLPLSQRFDRVTGVDISPSMIRLAKQRVGQRPEVDFVENLAELPADKRFDLVHSFIVIQHIRPTQGYPTIRELVDRVTPGGFFALHMTVGDLRPSRRILNRMRYRIPALHWLYNVTRKRPWNEPITEMNRYDLATIMQLLRGRYEAPLAFVDYDQNDHVGVMIIGKRT